MVTATLLDLRKWLEQEDVPHQEIKHASTLTLEDRARVLGVGLQSCVETILMKVVDSFTLFALSADLRMNSAAIKEQLGIHELRPAKDDEQWSMTTLVPNTMTPFGEPFMPFPLYADPSILRNTRVAFSAGTLTHSIIMRLDHYLRLAKPEIFQFASESRQSGSILKPSQGKEKIKSSQLLRTTIARKIPSVGGVAHLRYLILRNASC